MDLTELPATVDALIEGWRTDPPEMMRTWEKTLARLRATGQGDVAAALALTLSYNVAEFRALGANINAGLGHIHYDLVALRAHAGIPHEGCAEDSQ